MTLELIEAGKSARGGWTRGQLEILGEPWPPERGWKVRALGRVLSAVDRARFLAGGKGSP